MKGVFRTGFLFVFTVGAAFCAPVTWTLSNATFNDGGTLTGSFVLDVDAGTLTSWNLAASAGKILAAFTYTPSVSTVVFKPNGDNTCAGPCISFASNQQFPIGNGGTSENRILELSFAAPLTDSGGTVNLYTNNSSNTASHECLDCSPFRLFTNGLVAAAAVSQPIAPFAATVGVPYTLDLTTAQSGIQSQIQMVISQEAAQGLPVSYSYDVSSGSVPPGLSLGANGILSGIPALAGTYTFSFSATIMAGQQVIPTPAYPVVIVVQPGTGPALNVLPGSLSFSFSAGSAASSQFVSVSNEGAVPVTFTASVSTQSGGSWLSAPAGAISAPAYGQGSIAITANPASLAPGSYTGTVTVTVSPGATKFTIPVVLAITSLQQVLSVSQTGLSFEAVSGATTPPPQTFSVLNEGAGTLSWTAASTTLSGGSWLTEAPTGGTSGSGLTPVVQVAVNPSGLAPGSYYGQVQIAAAAPPAIAVVAAPQVVQAVTVVLNVLPSTANPTPLVQPSGLIFTAAAGGPNPPAQTVQVVDLSSKPLTYSTGAFVINKGANWLAAPSGGTVSPTQPASLVVQVQTTGLAVGVYTGDLAIDFNETSSTSHVAILLVVKGAAVSASTEKPRQAPACPSPALWPVFTQGISQGFSATVAWPTAASVTVVDNCGDPIPNAAVQLTFSNSASLTVSLQSVGGGVYSGTWAPSLAASSSDPVTITATALAQSYSPGTVAVSGTVLPNATTPSINQVVSAASLAPPAPPAPGSSIAILGSNLAQGPAQATGLPLTPQIPNTTTEVIFAGVALPLESVNTGQIDAIVPYTIPIGVPQQMVVRVGTTQSVPVTVTLAGVQPAVFTTDNSGTGPAVASDIQNPGSPFAVTAANPASDGDTIVISTSGLGALNSTVTAGAAGPSPAVPVSGTVTVTIGGAPATVMSAVLQPGAAGTYQVTVQVPSGISGPALPLVVTVNGQPSPPVMINVVNKGTTAPTGGQAISHVADGQGWNTSIIQLNTGTVPANFTLDFIDGFGNPWNLPLTYGTQNTTFSGSIPVGGSQTLQTAGTSGSAGNPATGWAQLVTSNSISGTAIFAYQGPGQPISEAAVPITSGGSTRFLLPFDNAPGYATGVAVANPNPSQATLNITYRDPSGNQTGTSSQMVPAMGHISFVIPASAGAGGAAEFDSPVAVVGLGIRSHANGSATAFTSVEALSAVPVGGKTITHIADGAQAGGGSWNTSVVLVNTDTAPANFTIKFWDGNGNPLTLPLGPDGNQSQLTGTIAPGGSRTIASQGTSATLLTGWAELDTTSPIGGTAIFGFQSGGTLSEASVPIIPDTHTNFEFPFDGSTGLATGVAFANPGASSATVNVTFNNAAGLAMGAPASFLVPAHGHLSVVLTVNAPGVAVATSTAPVSALAIRSHNGAFTSIRTFGLGGN